MKYRNHQAVAAVLAGFLADSFQQNALAATVVVPVPLHSARLKERGYNQCELLARHLAPALNLPLNAASVQRTRKTKSQMTLSADERLLNMQNAFSCVDDRLAAQAVLLIDDVCTTGATLDACAQAIKQSGAVSVWGLTLAKAL